MEEMDDNTAESIRARARESHVQIRHLHIKIMIPMPDHPLVRSYVAWQDTLLDAQDIVPVQIESYQKFVIFYGEVTAVETLRSLKSTGRPLPIWCGVAHVKDLDMTVCLISGKSQKIVGCKYDDLVSFWQERITNWAAQIMNLDADNIMVQLLFQDRVLVPSQTLSYNGIETGAELVAMVMPDSPPSLVDSSDSD